MPTLRTALPLLLAAAPLVAQNAPTPGGQQPYNSTTPIQQPTTPPASETPRERAPELRQEPARESRGTDFRLDVAFGAGNFKHATDGQPLLDDDTTAGYFRLGFEFVTECGWGGGIRLEGIGTDDDLFVDSGGSASEATDGELLLHATYKLDAGRVQMPIRGGLFFRGYGFEEKATGDRVDWMGAGLKIEIEPDFALLHGDTARWSLYGRLGLGAGGAAVEDDPKIIGSADTTMGAVDLELGTRLRFQHLDVGLGWLLRAANWAESDPVGAVVYREIDTRFSGIELSLAARF